MDLPQTPAGIADEAEEVFARQAVLAARVSRDRIAETLEQNGETVLAWLYRSTHL